VEEKLRGDFVAQKIHRRYPQRQAWQTTADGCAEGPARGVPGCYDSTVCSIEGGALRRVAEAIDRLEADRQNTDATDLEARIAAVWSMVSEIDPELARLASRYHKPE
jgi:hypothetical protein